MPTTTGGRSSPHGESACTAAVARFDSFCAERAAQAMRLCADEPPPGLMPSSASQRRKSVFPALPGVTYSVSASKNTEKPFANDACATLLICEWAQKRLVLAFFRSAAGGAARSAHATRGSSDSTIESSYVMGNVGSSSEPRNGGASGGLLRTSRRPVAAASAMPPSNPESWSPKPDGRRSTSVRSFSGDSACLARNASRRERTAAH
mmetsp:Transcript_22680/g.80954  ORF Transcript_22680/g.80954 Transcript_22680/m.80954 type:complete len:207 (+) Transcript_22680:799-1419(+)